MHQEIRHRVSELGPRPPGNKRRVGGLACNACRLRKSRYANSLQSSLAFVADARDSALPAHLARHLNWVASTL